MADSTEAHHLISVNLAPAFPTHLRGGPCKADRADFKVHLEINREAIFYCPDVMVAGQSVGVEQYDLRYPTLLAEVLSPSTENIDRREKLLNYPQISTVEEAILIAQDTREVTIHRRAEDWAPRLLTAPADVAEFRTIKLSLPLARIYEGMH